jgi:hypothetical protein
VEQEDEEMAETPEPEPEPGEKLEEKKPPAEVVSSIGDGRRRGKKRVMKKKRVLDDEGYMGQSEPSGSLSSHLGLCVLTSYPSHYPGRGLGVVLRRGCPSTDKEASYGYFHAIVVQC